MVKQVATNILKNELESGKLLTAHKRTYEATCKIVENPKTEIMPIEFNTR